MRKTLFLLCILISNTLLAQLQIGPFLGAGGYLGDLNYTPLKRVKPAIGVAGIYEIRKRFSLRGGITFGKLEGGDQWSGTTYLKENRNLSFKSNISEFSLVAEVTAFNLDKINWSPYAFAGVALFHFNPYVEDSGSKTYLRPLSTEGQGLAEYPNRKPYSLNQFSIPFGGGIKYILSDNVTLDLEMGLRRSSTDYLDDVSTNFVDPDILLQQRGATAVRLSYRGDEIPGGIAAFPDNGYPMKDTQRGSIKYKDWYYFTGFHLYFRLQGNSGGGKKGYGCPVNVF
jgi:opacity protein-like surface antigen